MLRGLLPASLCGLALASPSEAADLFRDKVAPLLVTRCLSCHNAQKKRGGLDLSTRTSALARARQLKKAGKPKEAEEIWSGLEALYADDPAGAALLKEMGRDRGL